jgi:molybdopterin-binding protein
MELSARNQLKGTVAAVKLGDVMAEIDVKVGDQTLTSTITRGSAEHLRLEKGSPCFVIIKATEVLIGTP